MITRVRIEATGKTENEVKDDILDFMQEVRASVFHPEPWHEEEPGLEVQTTATGFWGRMTITRRKDDKHGH